MRRCWTVAVMLTLTGCSGQQAVLAPHGDHAERIADLSWLLFVGGAIIFAIVMVCLGLAIWGSPRGRARLSANSTVALGGIAFPVVVLTALLFWGVWLMRESLAPADDSAVRVEVEGQQWWWRVTYVLPDSSRVESANEVRVPVGRPVTFMLSSPDVIHSFWVPNLGGKVDMIPGRVNTMTLTARREGIYRGQCAEYCGGPHALMAFDVIAMSPTDFDEWRAKLTTPVPASTQDELRGRELLVSSGCGACHAVRGTEAAGRVGPDLSLLGERRQLGAATLPNTPENIARFIVNSQHVKPGNLMPNMRVLPPGDLRALSHYLASLK